ncbi:MAG: FliH/SctL family protein [Porticoccaceae bacterium]|nr:hypothetical protein [Pseudomonadales bacterium]MCP5173028.1 hypothetical protein [Pseudomonadales bacterium]MCP5302502.1 hypothetical protein [Pseudomonadales bacterium]
MSEHSVSGATPADETAVQEGPVVERWQAPFFDPQASEARPDPEELEKLAHARGFQLGKWEGLEAGRLEAEKLVKRMTRIIEEMAQPFRGIDQQVASELVQVATLIAGQVVRRELSIDSGTVTAVVDEALKTLSDLSGDIQIYLNPADVAMVRELLVESLEGKSWKLVEDVEMLPGGCRVKTPLSYIDASVEKQMEVVFSTLLEASEEQLDY